MMEQIKLKNNGKKCVDKGGACRYRSKSLKNCCIVGCFIPDDIYGPEFEDQGILDIIADVQDFMPLEGDGLYLLQQVHDKYFPETSEYTLRKTVEKWINENVQDN